MEEGERWNPVKMGKEKEMEREVIRDRNWVMERDIDTGGQWRSRMREETEGKKPRKQDPNSSWAQQGVGKKEFEVRGTYYPEPGVAPNCKQTLPTPSGWVMGSWHVTWLGNLHSVRAAIRRYVMSRAMGKSCLQMVQMKLPHKMTHCESSLKSLL